MTGNIAAQSTKDNTGYLVNIIDFFAGIVSSLDQWVVARLETKFLKPLPLNQLYFLDAKVEHDDSRRITVQGTIFQLPPSMFPLDAGYASHKTVFAEGKVSMSKIPFTKLTLTTTDSSAASPKPKL